MNSFDRFASERNFAIIGELIKDKKFDSIEEINDFLKSSFGEHLENVPKGTDNKSKSKELVYEAYNHPKKVAYQMLKEALELDPNNIDVYNFLGEKTNDYDKAIKYYKKAIKIGKANLGEKYFEENMGYFWGLIETRPYMRAMMGLGYCYAGIEEFEKAKKIYRRMLDLNRMDNQGIRYLLAPLLLRNDDLSEYEEFMESVESENCAVYNFTNALYKFKKLGKCAKSDNELKKANKQNKYVLDYMIGIKEIPQEMPQFMSLGSENEAIIYIYDNFGLWIETQDAIPWIMEFKFNLLQKKLKK